MHSDKITNIHNSVCLNRHECPKMPFPDWSCNVIKTLKFVLYWILFGAQKQHTYCHPRHNPLILHKKRPSLKGFNHRTFIFFKRKKNPHSQVKTVREEAIIVGQCEKQEPLSTAAEGYTWAKKLFSTAPAEDLTHICLNHKFQKEHINIWGEKHWASNILSDSSNFWPAAVIVKLEINLRV